MQETSNNKNRQMESGVQINSNSPEILTNNIYTPAFLRQHLGKLVRVEFLIGTTYLEDRTRNISRGGRKLYCASIYTRRKSSVIGTNNLVDRIGILVDVGASYILLRSFENDSLVYCDLYSIKFVTISTTGMYGENRYW